MVGRGVNAGIYADFADEDLIEYSAILDGRTTAGCSYLDNKRMKWSEWKKTPDMIPPRHFGCRATLVRVVSGGDTSENAPDLRRITEINRIENASKANLIDDGTLKEGMTKRRKIQDIVSTQFNNMEMIQAEEIIRLRSYETVICYDRSGKYITSANGEDSRVSIPLEAIRHIRENGGILTHNHPGGSSFSSADLITASTLGVDEIRVVSEKYRYTAKPSSSWPNREAIKTGYNVNIVKYQNKVSTEGLSRVEWWQEVTHQAIRDLSRCR